jgi:hypothetical protein
MNPQADPASTGSTDAGKNLGRMALKSRFDTWAGVSPANCSGDGPVTGATSEGIVILNYLEA